MSKKFTRLMAILLSLNLTFSTGTFAAFAAEAEDGGTDTGYSESGDPAASAPKAEDSGTESTPDTSRHRLRRMQSPRLRRTASGMMFPRAMPLLPAAQTA